ncbi:related to microsomal signal peptidase 12kDa subunit [Ramularia collo-cygni]|uniref:Signal peptidase complex subunit 1 n=1 Tax=Ramularia collo-cygni TaxID=112498 RepID=A0A2D3VHQ7_9PEZI|nr:related to microsomal signal peptidase 12kDa subunit [Ramularia collo-cygni]CZT21479.1 related to microsomal signal peptidase 12kDa subunit [Ramularia collo-cygni]
MDAILEQARVIYEGEIDFSGQRLAELLTYTLLTLSGILAFLVGFSTQDIYKTLYIGGVGTLLTFVVVVPPWPYFQKNPLAWLPARTGAVGQRFDIEVDGKKVS